MAETFAAGELARKARMILRLLGRPDARLVEAGPGLWAIESGKGRRRGGPYRDRALRERTEVRGQTTFLIRERSMLCPKPSRILNPWQEF